MTSSSITALSAIKSAQDVARITGTPDADADAASMWATLSLFSGSKGLGFSAAQTTLAHDAEDVPPRAAQFLHDLTRAAHAAGAALACSSVLAGLSSESDEYGDVGLWLGGGDGVEARVVRLLRLDGGKIVRLDSSEPLPSALRNIPNAAAQSHVDALASLVAVLEERVELRVEDGEGRVVWVLVGRLEGGWAGLVGAGTWAEY